jgi:hypothetical protein
VLNFPEVLLISIEGFPLGFHCLRDGICAGSWPNSIWLIRSDGTSSMVGVNSPEVPAGEIRARASVLSLAGRLFISTILIVFWWLCSSISLLTLLISSCLSFSQLSFNCLMYCFAYNSSESSPCRGSLHFGF